MTSGWAFAKRAAAACSHPPLAGLARRRGLGRDAISRRIESGGEVVHVPEILDRILLGLAHQAVVHHRKDDPAEIHGRSDPPPPQHRPGHQPPAKQREVAQPLAKLLSADVMRGLRVHILELAAAELLVDGEAQTLLNECEPLNRIAIDFFDDLLDRLAAGLRCRLRRWLLFTGARWHGGKFNTIAVHSPRFGNKSAFRRLIYRKQRN